MTAIRKEGGGEERMGGTRGEEPTRQKSGRAMT